MESSAQEIQSQSCRYFKTPFKCFEVKFSRPDTIVCLSSFDISANQVSLPPHSVKRLIHFFRIRLIYSLTLCDIVVQDINKIKHVVRTLALRVLPVRTFGLTVAPILPA